MPVSKLPMQFEALNPRTLDQVSQALSQVGYVPHHPLDALQLRGQNNSPLALGRHKHSIIVEDDYVPEKPIKLVGMHKRRPRQRSVNPIRKPIQIELSENRGEFESFLDPRFLNQGDA